MRDLFRSISCILLGLLCGSTNFAQLNSANLIQFTEKDGVPGSQVSRILVDKQGYIWLGTINGLARYDGYEFKRFFSNPNDSGSIQGLVVWGLFEDSKGQIWAGTGPSKLNRYSPVTRSFKSYTYTHLIDRPANTEVGVRTMAMGPNGRLYFGVTTNYGETIKDGLIYLDENDDKIKKFNYSKDLSLENVIRLSSDKDQNVWVLSYSGLFKITPDEKMSRINFIDSFYEKNKEFPNIFSVDSKGHLWLITNKANLIEYDPKSGKYFYFPQEKIKETEDFSNRLFIDAHDNIWIGTSNGIRHFELEKKQFSYFKELSQKPFVSGAVLDLNVDSFGTVWIGTLSDGLLKYEERDRLKSLSYNKEDKNSLTPGWANSIYEAGNGHLWVTTSGQGTISGLNELDEYGNILHSIPFHSILTGMNHIAGLKEVSPGELLLNTNLGNFFYSIGKNTLKPAIIDGFEKHSFIHLFYTDKHQNQWICADNGLYKKSKNASAFIHYDLSKLPNGDASSNEITSAFESDLHGLWLLTNNGLFLYNYKTDKIERHGYDQKSGDIFITQDINSFYEDSSGTAWVGTWQGGLSKYSVETRKIKTFTRDDGLPSMGVQGMLADEKNNYLWLSTFDGLCRFNTLTGKSNNYSIADGIQSQLFADGSSMKTSRGLFIFGGANGITVFKPGEINKNSTPPRVFLTDLKLFDKSIIPGPLSILKKAINDTREIILAHHQNNISLDFIALHYSNPSKNRYAYKLENYDNDWREVGNQHTAFYPNLPPGEYIFRVKAANNNDVWNEEGATLRIKVLPPWWLTLWAYAAYALILALLGLLLNKYMRNRLLTHERQRTQARELEQAKSIETAYRTLEETHKNLKLTQTQLIQSEKMASLGELTAGIAHEIQNPLNFVNNFADVNTELIDELKQALQTGNSIEAIELAENIRDNEEKIKSHGQRADAIVKSMLQHSRNSSGDKALTDINQLAEEFLNLAFHGLRAKDKEFNTTLETDFKAAPGTVNIIPQDIGRVLLNLYNNAFYAVSARKKIGEESYSPKVSVSTRNIGDTIEIQIRDNGTGIPQKNLDKIFQPFFTTKPTGEGTGLGLSISYDIITKTHGGELKVETTEGEGTTFIILLK